MTSFHRPHYYCGIKDHPKQEKVKEFARCIERVHYFPKFSIKGTRYLRDKFRCETCYQIGLHPNKNTVREQTKFCDKCFEQNVTVNNLDFSINLPISLHDNANFGKIHYERTTKPMVKKALEKFGYETTRVIRRIGEIEEILTLICEIYRYIILNTEKFYSSDYIDYYIYCLEQYRDNYWTLCKNLNKYLNNLPDIEDKYKTLQESQSRKDMCSGCFKCKHELTSKLKNTKKGMICFECEKNEAIRKRIRAKEIDEQRRVHRDSSREQLLLDQEIDKLKFIIKAECPICNETFREFDPKQMIQAGCGYHSFCLTCADSWRNSCLVNTGREATCPMCRGPF